MAKKNNKGNYTEQVLKLEVTFIGNENVKTAKEIKELLGADDVRIINTKTFEHVGNRK
jgi:hypothetical protein